MEKTILYYVPDFDIYTEGNGLADTIVMARDAISLKGTDIEDNHRMLPIAGCIKV